MTDYDLQFGQSAKGCYISRNNAYVIRHEGRAWNVLDGHGALLAPDFPTLTAAKAWANNDQAVKLGYTDAARDGEPKTDPATGKPLPFARQPRGFQLAETVKVIAGYVMCDRSGLTRERQIDWYMTQAASEFGEAERAEIRAGVVARLAAEDAEDRQYREGMTAGEAWARATGTTAADLHMVLVVKGTHEYKAGHRAGVAKVRSERHNAETSQ